jgi:hypothetical protein
VPGSRDEGSKTIATSFVVHLPYVLSFGLLFSLFLCLLCSLFWSPFAPFVPVFLSVCFVPSGILLSSYTWVIIPSLPCLSSPLVPSVFVSILSFVFQFVLLFSWFSSFFCGLLLECSVFGAVAVEDGDLCKGVPAIGWRLIFSWGDELSKFTGCYCCRLEAGVQLCYGWWGMVLWLRLWWVIGQPLWYSCWLTDLPWQWFMDWCSHLVELLPWGEESWSSANWDVEELATVEKKLRPSVMDQWSVMVLGWR